jgi:hypothetical protein
LLPLTLTLSPQERGEGIRAASFPRIGPNVKGRDTSRKSFGCRRRSGGRKQRDLGASAGPWRNASLSRTAPCSKSSVHDYPMLAKSEVRVIVTEAISTSGRPRGMGDIVLPVVAPAIANAAFRLTGT